MSHENDATPSAWVWSQYKGSLNDTISHEAASLKPVRNKLDIKYLCAFLVLAIVVLAMIFYESPALKPPPQPNKAKMAEAEISKALTYLKEAYKISPRVETEKLITQVEKALTH